MSSSGQAPAILNPVSLHPRPFPEIVFDRRSEPIQEQNKVMSLRTMLPDCNVDHPVAALTDITRPTEIVSETYNNNNNNNTQEKSRKSHQFYDVFQPTMVTTLPWLRKNFVPSTVKSAVARHMSRASFWSDATFRTLVVTIQHERYMS